MNSMNTATASDVGIQERSNEKKWIKKEITVTKKYIVDEVNDHVMQIMPSSNKEHALR